MSNSKPFVDASVIYSLAGLINRFNSFVGSYASELNVTAEELDRLSAISNQITENVANNSTSGQPFNIVSTVGSKVINSYMDVAFSLFTRLYNYFESTNRAVGSNKAVRLVVPSDQLIKAMQMVFRTMITYVFLLAGLLQSIQTSCDRWRAIYSADEAEILGDQFDAPIFVDRALTLNFVGRPKKVSNSTENLVSAIQLYEAILGQAEKSLKNKAFLNSMDSMINFAKDLQKRVTTRKPIQIVRAPPKVVLPPETERSPALVEIEDFFTQADIFDPNTLSKSNMNEP